MATPSVQETRSELREKIDRWLLQRWWVRLWHDPALLLPVHLIRPSHGVITVAYESEHSRQSIAQHNPVLRATTAALFAAIEGLAPPTAAGAPSERSVA